MTKTVVKNSAYMEKPNVLQPFGIDRKMESVYRSLLGLADAPATSIARRSGIKRTSVYHILQNLISLGLVSSYRERGVVRFVAEHPNRLKSFLERQTILAERVIPELEKEILKTRQNPAIKLYEGKEGIKTMSEEVFKTKEKIILTVGSSSKLIDFIGGTYGFGKRRRGLGIFQRSLRFLKDHSIDSPSRMHEVRILPNLFSFPCYMTIFGSSVSIIPFEEPARGILIHDPAYAVMMKSFFEVLWNTAEKLKKESVITSPARFV